MAMAVLGSLWRAAIPGVGCWISANAVAIVALLAFALQGHASRWLTFVGANVLLALSLLLVLEGCLRFLGRRTRPWASYAGLGALLIGVAYWTFVAPDFNARVAVVSAYHAGLYVALAALMLRGRPSNRPRYSYYFLAAAALLLCAGHAARGVIYGFGILVQSGLMQVSPSNIIFLALGILAPPGLSIGVVMLAHDRLAERLERLANVDDLTGALARRAFLSIGDALLKASRRELPESPPDRCSKAGQDPGPGGTGRMPARHGPRAPHPHPDRRQSRRPQIGAWRPQNPHKSGSPAMVPTRIPRTKRH